MSYFSPLNTSVLKEYENIYKEIIETSILRDSGEFLQAKNAQTEICTPLHEMIESKLGSNQYNEEEGYIVLFVLAYCLYELGLTYIALNIKDQGITFLRQSLQYGTLGRSCSQISPLIPVLESKIIYAV